MANGVIKRIFQDHWKEFLKLNKKCIRPNVISEVEKMMECGSLEKGYIEFKCHKCGSTKKVGFRWGCVFLLPLCKPPKHSLAIIPNEGLHK